MMNDRETEGSLRSGGRPNGIAAWQVAVLMLLSALLAAGAVIGVLLLGVTRYTIADSKSGTDMTVLATLLNDVEKYYYFSDEMPSSEALLDGAAKGLVKTVGDTYAQYYTLEEYEAARNQMAGNFKGIGVLISQADNGTLINRVYENSPAEKAGLKAWDIITAADGQSVIGMDVNSVSALVGGEDGTSVVLTVLRDGNSLNISVERGDVYVRRVYTEQLGSGVGYIRIDSFTGYAADEFNTAAKELLDSGITSLIIDIRNNTGGELKTATAISDRVLPECVITTVEGKLVDPPEVYRSTAAESIDLPIVVLTNGYSASASEIFAAALRDNNAAVIMGTKTYGKGIVQTSWQIMPGKGYLKLTTDVYKTPNGEMIHGVGIYPDIEVEQDQGIANMDIFFIRRDYPERDLQVQAAVDYLLGLHD
jgi:carboxyl-terminal processing protease